MSITATRTTTALSGRIHRGSVAAVAGGALTTLMPVAFGLSGLRPAWGSVSFFAIDALFWAVTVVSWLLLLVAVNALHSELGSGRMGTATLAVTAAGMVGVLTGNGTELVTKTVNNTESDLGHLVFVIGFLVLLVGSLLLGLMVFRRRRDRLSRAAAAVLTLAAPLALGIAALGGVVVPGSNVGFWAGVGLPSGVAWMLLGLSLASPAAAPHGEKRATAA